MAVAQKVQVHRSLETCWEQLAASPFLAVDLETTGLSPYRDKIAVVSLAGEDGTILVDHVMHTGISPQLRRLLALPKLWLTHNGTCFDLLFLLQAGISCQGEHYDTLVGEQVLAVQDRKSVSKRLGPTMKRRIGRDHKMEASHQSWRHQTLTDEQVEYCEHDVRWLWAIREKQVSLCQARKLGRALEKEQQVSKVMAQMMWNGLPLNVEALQQRQAELLAEAADAQARVDEIIGPRVNLNSNPQLTERLRELGHPVPNIQAATLIKLGRRFPVARDVVTVKKARKRDEFYDEDWVNKFVIEGRVHAQFWQLGTGTGRYSSSDPNLQQIPRNMKSIIGHEEGLQVVSGDFSQIEVRVAAFYSQDPAMIAACEDEDIHRGMAEGMWPGATISKELRTQGKHGTFRLIYGGSAWGIVEDSEEAEEDVPTITLIEATEMRKNFLERFSGYRAYMIAKGIHMSRGGIRTLTLPWGHQRQYLPGKGTVNTYLNNQMQGTAALGLKEAVLEMDKQGLTKYLGALVHDEILSTSIPDNEAEDYRAALRDAMLVGMDRIYEDIKSHSAKVYQDVRTEVEMNTPGSRTWG